MIMFQGICILKGHNSLTFHFRLRFCTEVRVNILPICGLLADCLKGFIASDSLGSCIWPGTDLGDLYSCIQLFIELHYKGPAAVIFPFLDSFCQNSAGKKKKNVLHSVGKSQKIFLSSFYFEFHLSILVMFF